MSKPQGFNLKNKPGVSSRKESTRFPVFGVCWSPCANVYCGGGGSAKTGVGNAIVITHNSNFATTVIDTMSEICVGIDVYPKLVSVGICYVAAAIGTQIQVYHSKTGISMGFYELSVDEREMKGEEAEAFMVGFSCVAFAPDGHGLLAGCENGTILSFGLHWENVVATPPGEDAIAPPKVHFTKLAVLLGHEKAICGLSFLPDNSCFTCAKDGTAKLWSFQTGAEIATACCSIVDIDSNDKKKKRPVQQSSLVRGCAQGLQGLLYTVQSGRRGKAFVSQWEILQQKTNTAKIELAEIQRICVSDVPISAICMTFDKTALVLGSVDGSVIVISLKNANQLRIIRNYKEMHDLPVTALTSCYRTSRSEKIDVITASADGKLNFISFDKPPSSRFVMLLWIYVILFTLLFGWLSWRSNCYMHLLDTSKHSFSHDFRECLLYSLIDSNGIEQVIPH